MTEANVVFHMNTMLTIVLTLSLPPLLAAATIGLLVGLLQAVTQIQDQTLPMAIKIVVVLLILVFLGPLFVGPLYQHTEQLFREFPRLSNMGG